MTRTPERGKGFAARRSVVVRDYLVFMLKLTIDGLKDFVLLPLASIAILADLLIGGGRRPRLFYRVVRVSERFELWLNLNGALDELERGETDDGLFGASTAGSDTLLGKVEAWVRGKDHDAPGRSAKDRDTFGRDEPGRGASGGEASGRGASDENVADADRPDGGDVTRP